MHLTLSSLCLVSAFTVRQEGGVGVCEGRGGAEEHREELVRREDASGKEVRELQRVYEELESISVIFSPHLILPPSSACWT